MSNPDLTAQAAEAPKSLTQEILETMQIDLKTKGTFDQSGLESLSQWIELGEYKDKVGLKKAVSPSQKKDEDTKA